MKTTLRCLGFLFLGSLLTGAGCGAPEKGDPGEKGEKGDPGEKGSSGTVEPTLTLLSPASLYAGRSALVQITGIGGAFAAGSQVDFGDAAIKATKVEVGSNANLRVTVDVGLDARLGPHDVKVVSPRPAGEGTIELKLAGGLTVAPSLTVEPETGPMGMMVGPSAPQGGFIELAVKNLDYRDNPLGSGLKLAAPLSLISITSVSAARAQVVALVDALAPAGPVRTALSTTNPLGQSVGFVADPADTVAPKVAPRTPFELRLGGLKNGESIAARRATKLYKVTTTADGQLVQVMFTNFGTGLYPATSPRLLGYMAPTSGSFRDGRAIETSATPGMMMGTLFARTALIAMPKAGDAYLAIYTSNFDGSPDHSFTVTAKAGAAAALSSLKEPMMGDSPAAPVATIAELDKPYVGSDGAIDANYEFDYIKFKAKQNGRVYLAVSANPGLSIGLGVRGPDCNAPFVATASYSSSGAVANEFEAKAGETYCVRVFGDSAGTTPYQLIISPGL
jgi:hypothetical protein